MSDAEQDAPRRPMLESRSLGWRCARIVLALLVPAIVTVAQVSFNDLLTAAPMFAYLAGVFVVAWLAGRAAGSLSSVISIVLAGTYFLAPDSRITARAIFPACVFLMVTGLVIHLTHRLQYLERRSRRIGQAREEFLSAASHELKSPLAALKLQVTVLERELASGAAQERRQERMARLKKTVDRLTRLIDVVLDITRMQAGMLRLELGDVDLAQVAREVVERFAEDGEGPCRLELRADGPAVGRWDRARLDQVVTNLVSNACKYGDGKPVEVLVHGDADVVKLTVRDQGIGIPPESSARIFDRFERLIQSRKIQGAGLGLWITRQIVEAHGGKILVESEPGQGATFTVELRRMSA